MNTGDSITLPLPGPLGRFQIPPRSQLLLLSEGLYMLRMGFHVFEKHYPADERQTIRTALVLAEQILQLSDFKTDLDDENPSPVLRGALRLLGVLDDDDQIRDKQLPDGVARDNRILRRLREFEFAYLKERYETPPPALDQVPPSNPIAEPAPPAEGAPRVNDVAERDEAKGEEASTRLLLLISQLRRVLKQNKLPAPDLSAVELIPALPDSLHARRQALTWILDDIPSDHPARERVRTMLYRLDQHIQMQRELVFSLLNGDWGEQGGPAAKA